MKRIKLKELKTNIHRLDNSNKCIIDVKNIKNSPWVIYLETGDTELIYKDLNAKKGKYTLENFNKLVESIKKHGFTNKFINNKKLRDEFNGDNWPGGTSPVTILPNNLINNGNHRCAILYFLYGPEYEITLKNNVLQDVSKK